MRSPILAAITMVTAIAAAPADAQRLGPGTTYQQPGGGVPVVLPPPPMVNTNTPPRPYHNGGGQRWGGTVGGYWSGGVNAPGGWNAYRRPSRGHSLPRYWGSQNFYIGDFGAYGLRAPAQGYHWQRYYDDAVLLDDRGSVYDSVSGLDWDRGDYGYDDGYGYASGGQDGYASSDYAYAQGGQSGSVTYAPPAVVTQGGYSSSYSSGAGYSSQSGYAAGGYWYPSATTTVITINPAPTVTTTTTTTEYVEETRRYVAPRRVYHAPKRHYRAPVRRRCACRVAEQPILGS